MPGQALALVEPLTELSWADDTSAAALTEKRRGIRSAPSGGQITLKLEGTVPDWMDQVLDGLSDLLKLPNDWDGYGGAPISERIVRDSVLTLLMVAQPSSPPPCVVPLGSGGVQLEWHRRGLHLEIEIYPGEAPTFNCHNDQGEVAEGSLPADRAGLREIIRGLA